MANQQEIASLTVGLAITGSKSTNYILQWALTRFTKDTPKFKLIHVLTQVLAVPTPLGNLVPIDKVRADAYVKDVEAQVLLIKGNDVAETISNVVAQYQIQVLIVGITTRSAFTRKSGGNRTSSKICKCPPSFCTTYIVSKDGLSSVYSPGLESGSPSGVPKGNCRSSSSKNLNDSSGRGPPGFPSLPRSNLTSENLESSSYADRNRSFTLYDYLSGTASVYTDKDRRITSCTGGESSISSKLPGLDKEPTQESSQQGLMLSDNKDDVNTDLEKLRLELRHIQGAYKLVQDESVDASHQVVELAARRMEEEAQLREIQFRVDKANDDVQEEKAHRYAAEEAATRVKDVVRAEVMQKNRLQAKASRDADKKLRLEKQ